MEITALGMIETSGLLSAIEAADAGLKAAHVRLLGTDYVRGGLVMVRFEGDVAAVQAAVDAGTMAAQRIGHVLSSHVIPRAMPEVFCMLASDPSVGPGKRHQGGCASCGGCEGGLRELRGCRPPKPAKKAAEQEAPAEKAESTPGAKPEHGTPGETVPSTAGSTGERKAEHAPVPKEKEKEQKEAPASGETLSVEAAKKLRVVELRSRVRKLAGFPLTANEIRYANKAQLLAALEAYGKEHGGKNEG